MLRLRKANCKRNCKRNDRRDVRQFVTRRQRYRPVCHRTDQVKTETATSSVGCGKTKCRGYWKVGTGFSPYINPAESLGLYALRYAFHFPEAVLFSAASLATSDPTFCLSRSWSRARTSASSHMKRGAFRAFCSFRALFLVEPSPVESLTLATSPLAPANTPKNARQILCARRKRVDLHLRPCVIAPYTTLLKIADQIATARLPPGTEHPGLDGASQGRLQHLTTLIAHHFRRLLCGDLVRLVRLVRTFFQRLFGSISQARVLYD
jgi:hypothetical protein